MIISIHALVKRATHRFMRVAFGSVISIHALVKRATVFHCLYYTALLYFNPRPREEGDSKLIELIDEMGISIHALVKRATFGPAGTFYL